MLIFSTETIPGHEIAQSYGIVNGSVVRSRNMFRDMGAGIKGMVGGEVKSYTQLLDAAREEATQKMKQDAQRLGANAIIGVRFMTSQIMSGAAEVFVWGTAITLASVGTDHADTEAESDEEAD